MAGNDPNSNGNGNGNGHDSDGEKESNAQEQVKVLKQRLTGGPLGTEDVHEGFITLAEVAECALEQAIRNGKALESIHEHSHEDKASLGLVREQVSLVVAKVEATNLFMDRLDQSIVDGFKHVETELKGLKAEARELRSIVVDIALKLGVEVVDRDPVCDGDCKISVLQGGSEVR